MRQYLDLLQSVLDNGKERGDRTGTGTISTFGNQIRFDLKEGFPLITTKKINFRAAAHETLWFIRGSSDTKYLNDNGVKIWNHWADSSGDLGPVYGKQWRAWDATLSEGESTIDQLSQIIRQIKEDPNSRRHLISTWNVGHIPRMKLPPCHVLYQFYVCEGEISCAVYMRSVDLFIGLPFDMVDYALITQMVAQVTGLVPSELVFFLADTHIYLNHVDQVKLQLAREPRDLPQVILNPEIKDIDDFKYEDIKLIGYDPHPHIKAKVAV